MYTVKTALSKIETNLKILMMKFALYCPFLFLDSSQGLYRAVAASIDGSNYLVIDTTIYGTDLSCLFGIPQLQQENSSKLFYSFPQHLWSAIRKNQNMMIIITGRQAGTW